MIKDEIAMEIDNRLLESAEALSNKAKLMQLNPMVTS